jgi:hypothetical protein
MAITPWVRQYTLRELLDDSFDLFRERAPALLLAGMLPMLMVVLYTAVTRLFVIRENILTELTWDAFTRALESGPLWGYLFGYSCVLMLALAIGNLAQVRLAYAQATGGTATLHDVFARLGKATLGMLVVLVAFSLFAGAVSLAVFIVGAIFIGIGGAIANASNMVVGFIAMVLAVVATIVASLCALALVGIFFITAPVIMAIEHAGPFAALGKSFRFSSANFKAVLGALIVEMHVPVAFFPLALMLAYLLSQMAQALSPTLTVMLVGTIMSGLTMVVFFAMFSCFQVLVFLDARCRAESFDLVLLAQDIGLGDEVEQLFTRPATPQATPAGNYPNYMATPAAAPSLPPGPTVPGLTPPQASAAFPDYSAPPPPNAAPPAPEPVPAADAPSTPPTEGGPGAA